MRIFFIKLLLLPVILVVFNNKSFSQNLRFDSLSLPAIKILAADYNKTFEEQLHLYNGTEYLGYPKPFEEGQPYFIQDTWSKGTVSYDGNTYENVPILYNLVTDQLIISAYNNATKIQLLKEKISNFFIQNHFFIHLQKDSLPADMAESFYDVLASGKATLLARYTKNIQTYTKLTVVLQVFEKDHYFVKKNNKYFVLNNKKSLLSQVSDKRKEIQQYIKANRIRYRKDPQSAMIKVIDYYNQLTN